MGRRVFGIGNFCFILLVSLLLLTGCFGENQKYGLDKSRPVTLTLWHYYNGAQKEIFDELVSEFNETVGAKNGIVVEAVNQGNINEVSTKITDSVNYKVGSEETPDIFSAYADTVYEFNKLGVIADFSQYMSKEERDEYLDAYMKEGEFNGDGSLMIFPIAKATEVLTLNATDWDEFSKATGASEGLLSTWEGINELAEQYYNWTDSLSEEKDDGKAFFGRDSLANYILTGSKQLEQEIFQVSNGKVTYNINKEAIKKLWDNYYIPFINGYYAANGRFRSDDAKTGQIIAVVGSTSGATFFPTEVTLGDGSTYPINVKVFPAPNFKDSQPTATQQGAGMAISKTDKTKEYASTVFLKWFTQPKQNIKFSISSGYLPVKKISNSMDEINKALTENQMDISPIVLDTLKTSIDMVNNYTLYTNQAFDNGVKARDIIQYSISDTAKNNYETVKQQVESGIAKEDALVAFTSEEYFEQWLGELQKKLNELN